MNLAELVLLEFWSGASSSAVVPVFTLLTEPTLLWSSDGRVLIYVIDLADADEDRIYGFDFSNFPEVISGDSLDPNTTPQVTASVPGLTWSTPPGVVNPQVQIEVTSAATSLIGNLIYLSCRAKTLSGKWLVRRGILFVQGSAAGQY